MVGLSPFCVEHGSYICKIYIYVHKYLAFVFKGHHFVLFFPFLIYHVCLKLLYMYAICTSLYGFSLSVCLITKAVVSPIKRHISIYL